MKKTTALEMNRLSIEEYRNAEKLPLIVVLDDVRSLYNVGSVFRTSDAFRVEAIYLCGITATPDSSLKASQEIHKTALGAEDTVTWKYFKDATDAVESLKKEGFKVLAIEQCHGSTMLHDYRFGKEKTAIVMGNEEKGIYEENLKLCNEQVRIPMTGTIESLNVSVAAGVFIYEVVRQRLL